MPGSGRPPQKPADEPKSPLERYLAKQKAERAAKVAAEIAAQPKPRASVGTSVSSSGTKTETPKGARSLFRTQNPVPGPAAPPKKEAPPSLAGIQRPAGFEPPQPTKLSRWESVAESRLTDSEQFARDSGAPPIPPRDKVGERGAGANPFARQVSASAIAGEPAAIGPSAATGAYATSAPGPAAAAGATPAEDRTSPITHNDTQPDGLINVDFGPRFIAALIDGCILWAVSIPVTRVATAVLALAFGSVVELHHDGIAQLIWLALIYAYYGYFYPTKGASPGKMLMGIEVLNPDGRTRLTPWKAFFREALGKFISMVPFFMGYLIIMIRADHRALHDLLFDTRVVRKHQ